MLSYWMVTSKGSHYFPPRRKNPDFVLYRC